MVCPSRLRRQGGRFQKGIAARFPQQLVQGASTGAGVPDGEWRDQEPAGPRVAPTGSTWPFIAESAPIAPVLGMALSLSGRLAVSGRGLQGRACFFDQIRAIIGMVSDLLCPLILVCSSRASHRSAYRRCAWRSLQRLPSPDHLSCSRCWPCARHVNSPGSSLHQAPIALTRRESIVLVTERWVYLTLECGEIISGGRGAEARLLPERKGRRKRCSQDPRGILGTIAEPTGTDGCRLLCHQFSTSSLFLLADCISRYKTCSLTTKHMTSALLRLLANGDQGQNTPNTVFPLNTGR